MADVQKSYRLCQIVLHVSDSGETAEVYALPDSANQYMKYTTTDKVSLKDAIVAEMPAVKIKALHNVKPEQVINETLTSVTFWIESELNLAMSVGIAGFPFTPTDAHCGHPVKGIEESAPWNLGVAASVDSEIAALFAA